MLIQSDFKKQIFVKLTLFFDLKKNPFWKYVQNKSSFGQHTFLGFANINSQQLKLFWNLKWVWFAFLLFSILFFCIPFLPLTLIRLGFWGEFFLEVGGGAEGAESQFDPQFKFQKELIEYQYNFTQLLNKLFKAGWKWINAKCRHHLLYADVTSYFVIRKCQKIQIDENN